MNGKVCGLRSAVCGLVLLLAACGGGGGPAGTDLGVDGILDVAVPDAVSDGGPDEGRDAGQDVPPEAGDDGAGDTDASQPDAGDPGEAPDPGDDLDAVDAIDAVDADVPPPCTAETALAAIAEGKTWLGNAESGRALQAFEAALAECPDDTNALFGAALAEMIFGAELSVMSLSIAGQLAPGDPGPSENEYLAEQAHHIFVSLRSHFANALERLARLEGRDVAFDVESAPVHLGIKPRMDFHGTFDAGDVLLMEAVGNAATGFFALLAAQDLSTDLMTVAAIIRHRATIDGPFIVHLVTYLLNEDPRFLSLHPTDGVPMFQDARERLARAGEKLGEALDAMATLPMGEDQVSWTEPADGGAVWLSVRSAVRAGDEGTFQDEMEFLLSPTTRGAFEASSHSLRTPGAPVTLHAGLVPVLATMVAAMTQSGLMSELGVQLPGGIDLNGLGIDDLAGILSGLMPNVLALDWGTCMSTPVGFRALMPATTTDKGGLEDGFRMEWECPADLDEEGWPSGTLRLMCAKTATLADGPHFAGTPSEIAADGIPSGFPVFDFPDPTLHGLARVDLAGKSGSADATSYQPATGTTLNAALGKLVGGVLSLAGK